MARRAKNASSSSTEGRGWRDRPLRGGVMAQHLPCRVSSWRCGPSWAGRRTRTCLVWRMVWGILGIPTVFLLGTLCGKEMPSLAWIERAHTYGCAVSVAVPSCRGCASTFGKEYIKKCVCVVKALRTLIGSVLFPPFVCSCYEYAIQLRGCTPIIDIVARQRAQRRQRARRQEYPCPSAQHLRSLVADQAWKR